jgi:1,4-dihydroxy-2-naphthoate octaprenyltransferase
MRDQINDKAVGKHTLVVKLGFYKSKTYHVLLFTVAYLAFPIPYIISCIYYPALYVFIIPILFVHFIHVRKVLRIEEPKDFDPELKKVALSAFLFSLLFFITVLFHT